LLKILNPFQTEIPLLIQAYKQTLIFTPSSKINCVFVIFFEKHFGSFCLQQIFNYFFQSMKLRNNCSAGFVGKKGEEEDGIPSLFKQKIHFLPTFFSNKPDIGIKTTKLEVKSLKRFTKFLK
jgi:hypothetical protein